MNMTSFKYTNKQAVYLNRRSCRQWDEIPQNIYDAEMTNLSLLDYFVLKIKVPINNGMMIMKSFQIRSKYNIEYLIKETFV